MASPCQRLFSRGGRGAGGDGTVFSFPEGAGEWGRQWRGWNAGKRPSGSEPAALGARRRLAGRQARVRASGSPQPDSAANEWSVQQCATLLSCVTRPPALLPCWFQIVVGITSLGALNLKPFFEALSRPGVT